MRKIFGLFILATIVSCSPQEKEKIIYRNSNDLVTTPEVHSEVTGEFGALTVREGEFVGDTKIVPWSSWWFPTKDRYMFESSNITQLAPLQKYDLFVKKTHDVETNAALYEENEIYDPSEVNWAGLCHAWAVASVLHKEPKSSITRKDITFTVADQKALLLKSYENVSDLQIYGRRYNGSFNDDYNDIYPDQFHRFVQVYLFERHLPFLMDYDPSFPVWTVPAYNVKFKIVKDGENSAHVKAWITLASSFVDSPNFVGTKKTTKYYEYKLKGTWEGGELRVSSSEWMNDAVYDHPDFLIGYPTKVKRASLNKGLDIAMINEIVGEDYVKAE